MRAVVWCIAFAALFGLPSTSLAEEVRVAVAANFAGAMKKIAAEFEKSTGHKVLQTAGATGQFYNEIKNGAQFDVLIAGDDETPARLETEGFAVPGSRFTYAIGILVLWSAKPNFVDANGQVLKTGNFARLAIANPRMAPYGRAASETLKALGLTQALTPKFVIGGSVSDAYALIATGSSELGFVGLSQLIASGRVNDGSVWKVPPELYAPLRQDAVLLSKGRGNMAALALLRYLKSSAGKATILSSGYRL
ncbi:molybdate ABC transporter substrate-binding protein [Pseudoduganella sp. OTU4001]|uniref:molybdate ABC transporter substrate-binding protein n=1 Tax=Pseudoduganella sp. OTU4001 TaxID=3043854 RepID=UPI00313EED76